MKIEVDKARWALGSWSTCAGTAFCRLSTRIFCFYCRSPLTSDLFLFLPFQRWNLNPLQLQRCLCYTRHVAIAALRGRRRRGNGRSRSYFSRAVRNRTYLCPLSHSTFHHYIFISFSWLHAASAIAHHYATHTQKNDSNALS